MKDRKRIQNPEVSRQKKFLVLNFLFWILDSGSWLLEQTTK